ncbi:hypothetical protein HOT49_gp016 [Erwinia phage vB_EamM_Alexandra]|uniref:Uncharacterized protein n=1 Tax=Erwinia phage vB_EamM_Alexandra TaxID=2201424 RepID=A0A2Z4QDU9_9CAUD|nr:hypothetical protein HOT49_gp016 [Erwinia phage vB_EamM_Alexandra]AWY08297.1 hypothetical protein Alexandra_16 [Erwinia phage vB_EamM_Alexandra]
MEKSTVSLLVESMTAEERGLAGKYAGMTAGQIAKDETGIAFIVNNAFAMNHLLWLPDADLDWFTPIEEPSHLSVGLIGHVGDTPVYSDWYYGSPSDRQRPCDQIPRVGVVNVTTNEISLITVEQFAR